MYALTSAGFTVRVSLSYAPLTPTMSSTSGPAKAKPLDPSENPCQGINNTQR